MNPLTALDALPEAILPSFLQRLDALNAEIDERYAAAAAGHGFACSGCEENCCLTRFYHHTLVELVVLRKQFMRLSPADRQAAAQRAKAVLAVYETADRDGRTPRVMCPLNVDGRCLVYPGRPMICRMHGIPHVLRGPGRSPVCGPGCAAFSRQCGDGAGNRFDRTPLYQKMAALEKELRTTAGFAGKTRMTVAEMVILFGREAS